MKELSSWILERSIPGVHDCETLSVLDLVGKTASKTNEVVREHNTLNDKVDVIEEDIEDKVTNLNNKKVSHSDMLDIYKNDKGDHLGSWQGVTRPEMSEPGIAGAVIRNTEDISEIRTDLAEIENKTSHFVNIKLFGAKCDGVTDDSVAIQKAIDSISSSPLISKNVEFVGRCLITKTIHIPRYLIVNFNHCVIIPQGNNFTNGFAFSINSKSVVDWDYKYSINTTYINNFIMENPDNLNVKAFYVATSTTFNNIRTSGLYQTIKVIDKYIDAIKINIATISNHKGELYSIEQYNVNNKLGTINGDNWIISGIQIEGENRKLIRMNGNNSNVTLKNITNGHFYLERVEALLENIYIENGDIKIVNANVTLKDSTIYGMNLRILTNENGESKPCVLDNVKMTYFYWGDDNGLGKGQFIPSILISDDFKSPIHVRNCGQGIPRTFNCMNGLFINKVSKTNLLTDLPFFNQNSHIMSLESVFNVNGVISNSQYDSYLADCNFSVTKQEKLVIYNSDELLERGLPWKGATGNYYYKISVITDYARRIGKSQTFGPILMTQGERKIVEIVDQSGVNRNNFVIIERGISENNYVDMAILSVTNNSDSFIDTFNSANYTTFKTITTSPTSVLNDFYATSKNISTDNVTCIGSLPTVGTWKRGDRIISRTMASGTPRAWICTLGGSPGNWVSEGNV